MTILRRMGPALVALALVSVAGGCSDDGDWNPGPGYPIVPGLYVTDEDATIRAVWGQPVDGGLWIYPNPADLVHIAFNVSESSQVRIVIQRALGPGETALPVPRPGVGGALVGVPVSSHVATFADLTVVAGDNEFVWNGRDDDGSKVATGFYRVTVLAGDAVLTGDLWHVNLQDVRFPPGLDFGWQ